MKFRFSMKKTENETAVFAMGCFWSPQLLFSQIDGVIETEVGYAGGNEEFSNPSYEQVCTGKTGYAESVKIIFNPKLVSYNHLLDIFWKNHNPTSLNKQGNDIGSQYRSVIFYGDERQKKEAEKSKRDFQKNLDKSIVTEIVNLGNFYPAEEYHQDYLKKRGISSCRIN